MLTLQIKYVQRKQQQQRRRKAELAALKREDRQETVNRIGKMNDYQRDKLLERIETDNEKSQRIMQEKAALLETRHKLRKQVDRQKAKVLEEFEKMKKQGKIDVLFPFYLSSPRSSKASGSPSTPPPSLPWNSRISSPSQEPRTASRPRAGSALCNYHEGSRNLRSRE